MYLLLIIPICLSSLAWRSLQVIFFSTQASFTLHRKSHLETHLLFLIHKAHQNTAVPTYRIHKATNKQSSLLVSSFLKIIIIGLPLALTSILVISSYQFTKLIQIVVLFNCLNTLIKKAGGERKSCCYNKYKFISLLLSFCLAFHFLHINTPSILKAHFHFPILTLPISFWHYFSYIFYKKHKHWRLCLWRVVPNQLQIILTFLWGTTPLSGCLKKLDKNLLIYQVYFIIPTLKLLTLPSKGTRQ